MRQEGLKIHFLLWWPYFTFYVWGIITIPLSSSWNYTRSTGEANVRFGIFKTNVDKWLQKSPSPSHVVLLSVCFTWKLVGVYSKFLSFFLTSFLPSSVPLLPCMLYLNCPTQKTPVNCMSGLVYYFIVSQAFFVFCFTHWWILLMKGLVH